uniref:Fas-binding factor 1 C-terminal domain-containing protein n=1 Tax=Stegastes partitus TaxID=144197 RepID=A0A3B5AP27_9TELE
SSAKAAKKGELALDDEDDFMDALGFDSDKSNPKKKETLLCKYLFGHSIWFHVSEPLVEDDLTFTAYQPTVGSTPEGRHSRRQSVSASTPEKKPKPTTPTATRRQNSTDWLGLKPNDEPNYLEDGRKETKVSAESPKAPSSPVLERKPSLTSSHTTSAAKMAADSPVPRDSITKQTKSEVSKSQRKEEEEDDWLAGALSRKKALSNTEATTLKQEDSSDLKEKVDLESNVRYCARYNRRGNTLSPNPTTFHPVGDPRCSGSPGRLQTKPCNSYRCPALCPLCCLAPCGVGNHRKMAELIKYIKAHLTPSSKPKTCFIIQVKTLQLERDQSQMMLEKLQQRHKQDMELVENTHKARVKLLEDSAAQREARAQHECEDLMERLTTATRSAEQERSELQAQYQRKLAQAQQDRDREVERLRDLQRKSILEMKKDHEDQVHRLKRLKDEEIDAVTSATSQTRSLAGVIEQMEQFSSRLGELSSRVESTHEHTAHGLEQGARHRDEQLRTMQDRLTQQQKAMAEEKTYLKEIISRMDAQLNEQQRQLEKERWKMTAEQAKAESTLKSLEEERRVLSMQIGIEREELERAKSTLLEEQKSVMQHCADERRKLAAEWAHFHAQEKQRHERAEREVSSLLEKREGSIISLAQEQADLKLRTAELKQKEMAVAQERETLERLRDELDREKERISSTALRLKTKAQEVEAFSKLAADKYEEGERALQEAKRVEAEHEARLRSVHSQTEHLRQQEQRILKVRLSVRQLSVQYNGAHK